MVNLASFFNLAKFSNNFLIIPIFFIILSTLILLFITIKIKNHKLIIESKLIFNEIKW